MLIILQWTSKRGNGQRSSSGMTFLSLGIFGILYDSLEDVLFFVSGSDRKQLVNEVRHVSENCFHAS